MSKTNNKPEGLVMRAAQLDDLDACLDLSRQVGTGMTSMPTDESRWQDRLERSTRDFKVETPEMNHDEYFMLVEDINAKAIVGSGAIYAGIGVSVPFYSYKLNTIVSSSEKLDVTMKTRILHLVNDYTGATEVGSLFVSPDYRRDGIGKFVSRARMLLLADFPERFDPRVFAELRGWTDAQGKSPFWEHLGRKFFDLSFRKADFISAVEGWQFISDLMPKHPVYLDLLPQEAQDVVGKPHDHGVGAVKILEREGFRYSEYIDIFDAGPCVECQLQNIKTVANSRVRSVLKQSTAKLEDAPSFIMSNGNRKDYRITRAKAIEEGDNVSIDAHTMDLLHVKAGDSIRIVEE